jgi:hypothetical protein
MATERTLKDDSCDVCGCICFGNPPYEWKMRTTPRGEIKMCGTCFTRYAGFADPAKEARVRYLYRELKEARRVLRRARRLKAEYDRLAIEQPVNN